ncbi:MAG: hypothetical protein HYT69_01985 [Candidatus Zambryskibacteria bacterium]|nr:hypothetical protein [Candidatus Zambryskibacteria bacterium]
MNTKMTAKNFFLHLGAIVTFYASAIALITLLFEAINFAYPKVTNAYQYYFPSISFQVATLIVAFPLFLLLSWLLQKSYVAEPQLRESLVRRWLAYITLFIAGAVVAGDLITLIYTYLDGQELTTGFLLKVLALLAIAGGVFIYYLREIRNQIASRERNIWRIVALVVVIGSIILGFMVVGSPKAQRERRYDNQRVQDLQSIQWQVVNYYQQKGTLPNSLEQLRDPISGYMIPTDPKTEESYEYKKTGNLGFELCATFNKEGFNGIGLMPHPSYPGTIAIGKDAENWSHEAGRTCFDRIIDPELYPVRSKI